MLAILFRKIVWQLLNRFFSFLGSDQVLVFRFVIGKAGKEYGVSRLSKLKLAMRIRRNNRRTTSLTYWQQHLLLVEEILQVPKSLKGVVVECGCYAGASTVSLSLACALTNRRLIVCDSFEGLPRPKEDEKYEIQATSVDYYVWEEGQFSPEGGLAQVKKNVERFGNIEVCQFLKGYFNETLKDIGADSIVLVFEDADMRSSVEDCLRYLWPRLQEGCKFYSHEPSSIHVVGLFFDRQWWENNLQTSPPGFYGSGYGILAGLRYSRIGYAQKFDAGKIKERGKKIIHIGPKKV